MTRYVLKPSTVQIAIEDLHGRRIHPHFATYLGLVKYSKQQGTLQDLQYPYADYLKENYKIKASGDRNMVVGDSEKPFLTPFTLGFQPDSKWTGDNWKQQVSPGTAGRANADQGLHKVADMDGDAMTYSLHDDHVEEGLEYLAMEEKIPAIPVAVYLYRNDAFEVEDGEEEPELTDIVLLLGFRSESRRLAINSAPEIPSSLKAAAI